MDPRTESTLKLAIAELRLGHPITVDDCREIFDLVRPLVPSGLSLDVVIDGATIAITVGASSGTPTTYRTAFAI